MKRIILLIFSFGLSVSAQDNTFDILKNLSIFNEAYSKVNIEFVDQPQPGELIKVGIDAMLNSLDPYTVYYPQTMIEDYRISELEGFSSIGVVLDSINEQLVVIQVLENSSAMEQGIEPGYALKKVNNGSLEGLSLREINELISGKQTTTVACEFKNNANESLKIDLTRSNEKPATVPYYGKTSDGYGYIKLDQFTATAFQEVYAAYENLNKEGISGLILDLRDNGGGLLVEAVKIVNMFVAKGIPLVEMKGRTPEQNKIYTTPNDPVALDLPLVVLINERSASASEIVSASLQDLDRALVLGYNSFGKGLVQLVKELSYGAQMKITIAKYYTPSGRCVQKYDYAHKKEEDSTDFTMFTTTNGRKVYDKSGVTPDIKLMDFTEDPLYKAIQENKLMEEFCINYLKNNTLDSTLQFQGVLAQEFLDFLKEKNVEFVTPAYQAVLDLEAKNREESLGLDAQMLETLLSSQKPNLEAQYNPMSSVLAEELKQMMVKMKFGATIMYNYLLQNDTFIFESVNYLNQPQEINRILAGE